MRILEIGDRALFKRERPEATTLVWSGPDHALPSRLDALALDAGVARSIVGDIASGRYDAVVWHPPERDPWRDARWGLANPRAWRAWRVVLGLRRVPGVPLIVVDTRDDRRPTRTAAAMFDRADAVFLREFPLDAGELGLDEADPVLAKFRPLSIGLGRERLEAMPVAPVAKTHDLFFAGQVDTPLRRDGLPGLRALAREGLRVDLPEGRLPSAEFYRRCASARIVWSPEGRGWQCFRHYEAAACGAVALMNRPSIRQHAELVDGVHALYYDPAPGALATAVREALADPSRLARIAEAGRVRVLENHTHAAIVERVVAAIHEWSPGVNRRRPIPPDRRSAGHGAPAGSTGLDRRR